MALSKRGKTFHCHFVVNGQRIRQSLKTSDWREAQAKEKQLISEVTEGKATQAALEIVVAQQSHDISPRIRKAPI